MIGALLQIPKILLVTGLAVCGGAYFVAHRHSSYYMGTDAETVDCISCHVDAVKGSPLDRLLRPQYVSPVNLAVSPDGSELYVTGHEDNTIQVVDLASRSVSARIDVGERPREILLTPDGVTAFVANEWSDSISVIDLASREVRETIRAGNMPTGMALTPDGTALFVANWQGDSISLINLETGRETSRMVGGGSPNLMAVSPDQSKLLVTNELSYLNTKREMPVSEVTLIDIPTRRVTQRLRFENAHLLEGVTFLPPGDLAVVALVRPKNLLPVIHVARGWTMNNGIGLIDLNSGRVVQLLLDGPNASYADPYDVVTTPDGSLLFVSHSGVDQISVIDTRKLREVAKESLNDSTTETAHRLDLSDRFVVKRIPTGSNPKGLAVSPDGTRLFVAERLSDRILVVDVERLEPAFSIPLNDNSHETVIRKGERLFNSAGNTFQGQFSCRSCHPRNHSDRLQYDFEPDGLGVDVVDNRTLLGIGQTAPFKWNGKNTSLFMQCGVRFSRILTRVDPFTPDELSALVAFIRSLPNPPNPNRSPDGELNESQLRGKHFFERTHTKDGEPIPENNQCVTCHPAPLFTNRKNADIGSASPTDSQKEFDTPHLGNIYSSAPYLHDGKAMTLEEIWTVFNPDDTHGVTRDMSNRDLNDLIEYLKTL